MTRKVVKSIQIILSGLIGLYVAVLLLLNIPYVQQQVTTFVADKLEELLQSNLHIGHITYGFPNRLIIDDISLDDRQGEDLLDVARLSAKFDLSELFKGQIAIHSAQLFGFDIHLHKDTPESQPNFQFIAEALASKDTVSVSSPIDLRINTLLVRRGRVNYDVRSLPETPGIFNANHVGIKDFNATIALKALKNDSLNVTVKRFDFKEKSGLTLKNMKLRLTADTTRLTLSDFEIQMPGSRIASNNIQVRYDLRKGNLLKNFHAEGSVTGTSYITPGDIACFVPTLRSFNDPLRISLQAEGDTRGIRMDNLRVTSENNDVILHLTNGVADFTEKRNPYLHATLQKMNISSTGINFLMRNLRDDNAETPAVLQHLGFVNFTGEVTGHLSDLQTSGWLRSGIGDIKTSIRLTITPGNQTKYLGNIYSEKLDLMQLLGKKVKLGDAAFNIDFAGTHTATQPPSIHIKGVLPTLQYSGYEYQNIRMDGILGKQGFKGLLSLNDRNVSLQINGEMTPNKDIPSFDLTARLSHFRPHALNLTESYKDCEYSMTMKAHFRGNNPDNINGEINIDSLTAIVPEDFFYMHNLNIQADVMDGKRKLITLHSDFLNARVVGEYAYETLPESFIRLINQYLPSLINSPSGHTRLETNSLNNSFEFNMKIRDSKFYPYVLNLPLKIDQTAEIQGYVDDLAGKLRLEGYFPSLKYGKDKYESGVLICKNDSNGITADFNISKQMAGASRLSLFMNAKAANDRLQSHIVWGNDTENTYCGKLNMETTFVRNKQHPQQLYANLRIKPTEIILNDTIWHVHESSIDFTPEKISINNLRIDHGQQHLAVNGKLTKDEKDSLIVDLSQIRVEYILDIVQFDDVKFTGSATGKAYVSRALDSPQADTRLFIKNFCFNGGLMGDMDIYGEWDNEVGVHLDADIREEGISHTTVKGFVSPISNGLDLSIGTDSTSLAFLNSFIGGIFSNLKGRSTGNLRLHGPFKALNLEGDVIADASAKVDVLNTVFSLKQDSIHLTRTEIQFPNVTLYDKENHSGSVTGKLTHNNLGNIRYNFNIDAENFLFYDGKKSESLPFYGTVYGTGKAVLTGGGGSLNVNADIRTEPNTLFIYNAGTPDEVTDSKFITFVDKTPRSQQYELPFLFKEMLENKEKANDDTPLDIRINVTAETNPNATVKVILDPTSGDYVSVHGSGTITANYFNKGAFTMQGTYTLNDGVYKMSMQDVIRKDFQIQAGSEVSFGGDPYEADLNLKAIYTVNSASLSDLAPDMTFSQNTVKVNCIINLTGKLFSPDLSFDLDLPTVNEEERQLVRSAISTEEQMKMQIIYLLGIGKFYMYDYATNEERRSSDTMSSLLSSTLSGQLNNMLSQALNMNNWSFASNFSTGERGWTDMEVEGMLSGRLLNNRLLVNGNFGYRENELANTNFVGDFNIQWLLTPSGEISLKAYNQTNDRYFAKTTFNTQGIGIIYKREFNTWRDFFKKKKK